MVKAFGGSPGNHEGMVEAELLRKQIATPNPTELKKARAVASKQVKAAMLTSGADRRKYGKLRDDLTNNCLLGTDQYPDTFEKASSLLSNYQHTRRLTHSERTRTTRVWHSCNEVGEAVEEAAVRRKRDKDPRPTPAGAVKEQEMRSAR
jgi:hypothetical protein